MCRDLESIKNLIKARENEEVEFKKAGRLVETRKK